MATTHDEKLAKDKHSGSFTSACVGVLLILKRHYSSPDDIIYVKKNPCLLFVWGPSAAFLSRRLFSKRKWEGCLYRMSRNSSHPPVFFLFSVVWFTDLFLHMGSIPHLTASFQAVLCFQQYDSFPLNGPLGVSIRWSHICTCTLHMPQNAWHVKCFFFFLPIVFPLLYVAK